MKMITITLNDKKYSVKFFSGRAMREMNTVETMINQLKDNKAPEAKMIDEACQWFCSLFEDQFTVNELYDNYPVDKLLPDMITAYYAVLTGMTKVLTDFPTKPTAEAISPEK